MMVNGKWRDNISCRVRRFRHPGSLSCREAFIANARGNRLEAAIPPYEEETIMKFDVQFKIKNRLGAKSRYSLGEVCVCLVDRYSLKENEIANIVTLQEGDSFSNEDMTVTKVEE
jgi:hypothetical protein